MSTQETSTPRALRMFDMILFSVCAILLLSQVTLTAQIGPSAVVWTVVMIAAFFLPYGLMTAELGSTYPDTGGIYAWIVRAFGNRWGTRVSWWYWLNVALWVPSVYLMFSVVLSDMFFPGLGFWPQVGIALVLIGVNWLVNVLTLDTGKWVSNLGAMITVGVIVLIGVAGFVAWSGDGSATNFTWTTESMIPTAPTVALALPIIIYNFLGFELMSSASNEMRNPRRDVPRTIVIAGVLIGAFYLISTIGMQVIVPADEISETSGLLDVLTTVFGAGVFTTVLGIGILYAFFAALIPWTIGANRAAAEAAEQGDLPPVFKRMSAKRRTPVGAAGFTALVSAAITLVYGVLFSLTNGDIDALFWSLFAFSSIVFLLPYVAMSLGVPAPAPDRPGRTPAVHRAGQGVRRLAVGHAGRRTAGRRCVLLRVEPVGGVRCHDHVADPRWPRRDVRRPGAAGVALAALEARRTPGGGGGGGPRRDRSGHPGRYRPDLRIPRG